MKPLLFTSCLAVCIALAAMLSAPASYVSFPGAGTGDVVGPASSTDNAIVRFDGTTGKLVQNSGVTVNDSGFVTAVIVDVAGVRLNTAGVLATSTAGIGFSDNSTVGSGTKDTSLFRDAANTLAQRNGTTTQTHRLYRTFTDASNYSRLAHSFAASGRAVFAAETAGTGEDDINIELTPAGTGGVVVGISGTAIKSILSATATLNFGSILAASSEDLTITVTGAAVGDSVALGLPAAPDTTTTFNGFVSAANTVTVRCFNVGTIAVDPASATYRATVNHY